MTIEKNINGRALDIKVIGRLDTVTAPELEAELTNCYNDVDSITFDFEALDYISSAGLRVLLAAQKTMNAKNGSLEINHPNDMILEVFDITGFSSILKINK